MSTLETKKQDLPPPQDTAAANTPEKEMAPKNTAATNKPSQEMTPEEKHLKELHDNRHEKKGARRVFHLVNFGGLHVLFNSTVSLFIAYNLLPTKGAKALKESLGRIATPVNAFFSKLTTPIKKLFNSNYVEPSAEELAAKIAHSARSRVETAFMCIAGFLALAPVYYLENHRAGFLNAVDNFFHPGRSKAEKEAAALKEGDEPKETVSNLFRARMVGLGVVFGTDALQQRLNNKLGYDKGNIDTAVWKWGAKTSEGLSDKWRHRLTSFFARKDVDLSGIQHEMRGHLLEAINKPGTPEALALQRHSDNLAVIQKRIEKTADRSVLDRLGQELKATNDAFNKANPHLKPHVDRAVFAEQSRLLVTKEIFLTVLISVVIYTAAKAKFMSDFFEKVGLKKKEHKPQKDSTDSTLDKKEAESVAVAPAEAAQEKIWASKAEKRDAKKENAPEASFADAAVKSQNQGVAATLG